MITKEGLLELLNEYIEHFDNDKLSNDQVKSWLDRKWIPQVRRVLNET